MGAFCKRVIPILRIFDETKAREFYLDWLEFKVDWEHRFEPGMPLYMQVSRDTLTLHLSEHHGDATPGARVYVETEMAEALHRELNAKQYKNNRPGLEKTPWGTLCTEVIDPFGNRITFEQRIAGT